MQVSTGNAAILHCGCVSNDCCCFLYSHHSPQQVGPSLRVCLTVCMYVEWLYHLWNCSAQTLLSILYMHVSVIIVILLCPLFVSVYSIAVCTLVHFHVHVWFSALPRIPCDSSSLPPPPWLLALYAHSCGVGWQRDHQLPFVCTTVGHTCASAWHLASWEKCDITAFFSPWPKQVSSHVHPLGLCSLQPLSLGSTLHILKIEL